MGRGLTGWGERCGCYRLPMRRTLAALPLFLSSALAADLLLPEAKHAEAITVPTTRVEIAADGTAQYEGRSWGMFDTSSLVEPLRAWHVGTPNGVLLLAGDRRADFRAVRGVLKAAWAAELPEVGLLAAGAGVSAIRTGLPAKDAPDIDALRDVPPPLTIHLRGASTSVTRVAADQVDLPNRLGAPDLDGLAALIAEDHRLHPSAHMVVVNTEDGVPYGRTFAVVDLTRGLGYPDTLLAGGPVTPASTVSPAPLEARTFTLPFSTRLEANGDAVFALTDGSEKRLSHADVVGYTAGCDETLCDVVAYTALDAYQLGAAPVDILRFGALFGRRVTRSPGRLGGPKIHLDGTFSPLVQVPGTEPPRVSNVLGGAPILLGALEKALIDAGIKARTSDVQACYSRLLTRDPKASGKVTIKFVIAPDGSVSSAAVKNSTLADPEMLDCLTATFRTFEFPEPKGGGIVIVSYPFVFSPS